jgi:hypothetical protein
VPDPSRARRTIGGVLAGTLACLAMLAACGWRGGSEPASRLLAVHNVMRVMGRPSLGPVSQGSLAEGQQVRLPLRLGAACTTIVAFGGAGTRDLSLTLLGPDGSEVSKETAFDAQAVLSVCVERPGDYVVVVKMASGEGEYVASSFAGGDEPKDAGSGAQAEASGGTCQAPTALLPGRTYTGSTEDAVDENQGSCGHSSGHERVYRLDLGSRQRVTIDVAAQFDSVLYVRKGDCSDEDAEVACNDDAPGSGHHSKVGAVLDTGTYYVIVDGYGDGEGSYRLQMSTRNAPSLSEICGAARPLAAAATVAGHLADAFDNAHGSCGQGAKGPDVPYRFDLAVRSRVRLTEQSSDFRPVVHVRRTCEDDKTEIACAARGVKNGQATWAGVLDPGTYWVYADSSDDGENGTFTLSAETAPAGGASAGGGVKGDGCGDAVSLADLAGTVEGDTFAARDDVAVSCGGPGSADVAYRIDLKHRSRLRASLNADASSHVLALTKSCADRSAEISCARTVDRELDPGTYFLVVDSKSADSMGHFSLSYGIKDVVLTQAACAKVEAIAFGRSVSGTTAGAANRFTPSCGAKAAPGAAPDRVYRFTVPRQMPVRATLDTTGFRGVLSIRRTCADESSEVQCAGGSEGATHVQIKRSIPTGTYYAVVDGAGASSGGAFTLRVEEDK